MPAAAEGCEGISGCHAGYVRCPSYDVAVDLTYDCAAMTSAQGRLADTIGVFYDAADKTSEGAMAAHAYKRAVDDLDSGLGREMVIELRLWP